MGRKRAPVWQYYKTDGKSAECIYCSRLYTIINATKMMKHMTKCVKCPIEIRQYISNESEKKQDLTSTPTPQNSIVVPTASTSTSISDLQISASFVADTSSIETEKNTSFRSSTLSITDSISINEQIQITEMLAKAIFVSGTPLSIVDHPLWLDLFAKLRPSYKPPKRQIIETMYLDAEYNDMKSKVSQLLTEAKTLNLQCDGWSNMRNEGTLNFVVTTPKPVFIDCINTESNHYTGEYLANEIDKILTKYGPTNFFVIIGDNADNVREAFKILKERYSHLIPVGCLAHTLHLLSNDILKCCTISKFLSKVVDLIETICETKILSSIFAKINEERNCKTSLKLPCKTRWESYLQCLQSVLECKATIQNLAVNEEASSILEPEIKSLVLDDIFWVKIEKITAILLPIFLWISQLKAEEPLIHKTHQAFFEINGILQIAIPQLSLTKPEEVQLMKTFNDRKEFAIGPIHLAATLLDPKSQGYNLSAEEQLDAIEFIDKIASEMAKDDKKVIAELTAYRSKDEGIWAKEFLWKSADKMTPAVWWKGMCSSSPLSEIAVKILSAPTTSAATERSSFSCEHKTKRKRLTTERAGKLTYIAHNWKLWNPEKNSNDDPESSACEEESEMDIFG